MSREAYDRMRKAAEGTALAGRMDSLNTELHLTPESAEWSIAALALIGTQPLIEALREATTTIARMTDALPDGMRRAGSEIVRGLAEDIASAATDRIATTGIAHITERHDELVHAAAKSIGGTIGVFDKGSNKAVRRLEEASSKILVHADDVKLHHRSAMQFMAGVHNKLWIALAIAAVLGALATYGFDHGAGIFHALRGAMHR